MRISGNKVLKMEIGNLNSMVKILNVRFISNLEHLTILTSLLQTRNIFAVPLYPKAPNQQHTCSLN